MIESFLLKIKPFRKHFGLFALFLLLLQMFDGILPQIQILLLHGHVLIPTPIGRIPLLILLLGTSLIYGGNLPKIFWMPYILFITYLAIDFLYLLIFKGYNSHPIYGLATYNNYYSFFLFLPFAFSLYETISTSVFYRILQSVSIPVILLGLAQYFLNKSILPLESLDKHFSVQSVFFYKNHIRAFSLFSSGLLFGTFCNLILGISVAYFLASTGQRRILSAAITILALAGSIVSLTRSNIVQSFLILFSVGIIHSVQKGLPIKRIGGWLPVMILLLSLGLMLSAPLIHRSTMVLDKTSGHPEIKVGLSDYTSNDSLSIRYDNWKNLVREYIKTPADLIFGSGRVQSYHSPFSTVRFIDNSYLATILNTGIFGLCFLLIILISLWIYFYKKARESGDRMATGIAAFIATWPFYGLINNAWYVYGIVSLLGVLTASDKFNSRVK